MSRLPRHRGLVAKPENLGVTPLAPGQVSQSARVRLRREAADWWMSLTPEQRGRMIEDLYRLKKVIG